MGSKEQPHLVLKGDCLKQLKELVESDIRGQVHVTFLDPPFNQDKDYDYHNDSMQKKDYWEWMQEVCQLVYDLSGEGGAIYFMQREKNTQQVFRVLKDAGWTYQNLIIWKKLTSAVPQKYRFGKQYQIIAFFTKGKRPQVFHRLRIDLPLEPHHKFERENGVYATDLWTDIRELTSGYFAGDEALRDEDDNRLHKQQAPVALLTRIILSSSNVGDLILDPFSGTGTTGVVAKQLNRRSINIEIDPKNVEIINMRLKEDLEGDDISELRHYYRFTKKLDKIWPSDLVKEKKDIHGSLLQFLDKSKITEK